MVNSEKSSIFADEMRKVLVILFLLCAAALGYAEQRSGYAEQRSGYSVCLVDVSGHPAYLLLPDGACPAVSAQSSVRCYPAVLVLHDHGAHFTIGKEKMVDPIRRADWDSAVNALVADDAKAWVHRFYHDMFVGDSLARAGFVVLVTDALYWGERRQPDDQKTFYERHLSETGEAWFNTILREDKEAVTYLCSLPCVDTARIYSFGFSMGAYRSWQLAAEDSRIAGCAAANWMTTVAYTGGFITGKSSWSMYRPAPADSLSEPADYPVIAAHICPRPFLLMYGTRDHVIRPEGTEQAVDAIRRLWSDGNTFTPMALDCDHEFTPEHYSILLRWLREQSGR